MPVCEIALGGHVEKFCYSSAIDWCMYQVIFFFGWVKDDIVILSTASPSLRAVLTQSYVLVLRQPGYSPS